MSNHIVTIPYPYLLFIDNAVDELISAKTACGIAYWKPFRCLGKLKSNSAQINLSLPELTLEQAVKKGCKTLVVGTANFGGKMNQDWVPAFEKALSLGLNVASGLHQKLSDISSLKQIAKTKGTKVYDFRHIDTEFPIATGKPRKGKRLLTVGTDCGVGKMFTALAIEKELQNRQINADFRATGQTGILIAGSGIPFDSITTDFVAGAMEALSPEASNSHWDIIEGQGSISHPACGMVLALIHASQPDALIMCHEPTRSHLYDLEHMKVPSLEEAMEENLKAANLTNKNAKFVGISLNTSRLSRKEAVILLNKYEKKFNLPCVDPVLTGVKAIIDKMTIDYNLKI